MAGVVAVVCVLGWAEARASVYLRWNAAGYRPEQPKSVVAMSERDLTGRRWLVERRAPDGAGTVVAEGRFAASAVGRGDHTPLPFNHVADVSGLRVPGVYWFSTDEATAAELQVSESAYARLLALPLRHLRAMRSGSHETGIRRFSHGGDARAPMFVPDGDPAKGKWTPAAPARTVDASGGWYDAGDQIKFTLNIAYTSYHLLLAYRLAPALFTREQSRSELPDVLDEARHGLEFLMRVHPEEDTFIVQVGDEHDHNQRLRLPEDDPLDGKRPALAALSRVHMGSAAAALALGARTFRELGRGADAARYAVQARAIYARSQKPDTVTTAFERGQVNDFYRDPTDADQLALAAAELFALTEDDGYLADARRFAPPPGREAGWGDWNGIANAALAKHDPGARERLLAEAGQYAARAETNGRPWGIPGRYVWGSVHRWTGAANIARLASLAAEPDPGRDALFWSMVDYVFGRNNWGVSFLFSEELPNTLRHLYSPAYALLGVFPTGAFSEGPGSRSTHEKMDRYFKLPKDDPLARFHTAAGVFHDNDTDFICQEATIGGQGDLLLLLTLAAR